MRPTSRISGFVKGKGLIGTEVGQKGVLGAYLFIIFILLTGGGVFWQTEKGGGVFENGVLMCGPNSKKGVLGAAAPPPPQVRHWGVFPIQLRLNSRGGYTGPPLKLTPHFVQLTVL